MSPRETNKWDALLKVTLKKGGIAKHRLFGPLHNKIPKKSFLSSLFQSQHEAYDYHQTNHCIEEDYCNTMLPRHLENHRSISVSWSTLVTTFVLVFVFYQITDPFRRRGLEVDNDSPRQKSSVYFYVNAILYGWLLSSIALTIIPQFSDHYNEIIAAALFFPMLFASIGAVLLGRGVTRFANLILLHSRRMIISSSSLSGPRGTTDNSSISTSMSWEKWWVGPPRTLFFKPFRKICKQAFCITVALCFLYADCWSRDLGAFKLREDGGGAVCTVVFTPFSLFSSFTVQSQRNSNDMIIHGVEENTIWVIWLMVVLFILALYAQDEYLGRHLLKGGKVRLRRSGLIDNSDFSSEDEEIPSEIGLSTSSSEKLVNSMKHSNSLASLHQAAMNDTEESDVESLSWVESHDPFPLEDDDFSESEEYVDNYQGNIVTSIHHSFRTIVEKRNQVIERPEDTLSMVPWYSVLLLQTVFDILVEITVFVGRFDARTLRPALHKISSNNLGSKSFGDFDNGVLFDHREKSNSGDGFWFDWMADCGDGFNSSYQVARTLAQPSIQAINESSPNKVTLPRGQILLIGGDLCYPGPSEFNFENRFFRTFEDALPPPSSFRKAAISISKPNFPIKGWCDKICFKKEKGRRLKDYLGPSVYLLPGNHDWYDGLASYTRFVLSRDWLGGWLMPQKHSYFAIALPKGWWIFGLDHGLSTDIDIDQFKYFAEISANFVKSTDSVIILNHEPAWVIEADDESHKNSHETNVRELLDHHLCGKVRLRIAGDLHHYTRHIPVQKKTGSRFSPLKRSLSLPRSTSNNEGKEATEDSVVHGLDLTPELIVSGGGGAFLHGTHTFSNRIKVANRDHYERVCAYPSDSLSRRIAWLNIWQFRWRNWRLDAVWAVGYFCISSSLFPLCGIYADYLNSKSENPLDTIKWFLQMLISLFKEIFRTGRVSLVFSLLSLVALFCLTDSHFRPIPRTLWGIGHGMLHCFAALSCLLFIELLIEYAIANHIISVDLPLNGANDDGMNLQDTLYEEYTTHFAHLFRHNFDENINLPYYSKNKVFIELLFKFDFAQILFASLKKARDIPLLKTTLSLFDLPGQIAQQHVDICNDLYTEGIPMVYGGLVPIERILLTLYLASVGLYFVILAIPFAGSIFGTWLALSLNLFGGQYNGGFSSLRIQHWKNFLRLHIKENGDLEVFSIGLDRVPKKWKKDERWSGNDYEMKARKKSRQNDDDVPSWKWKRPSKWVPDRKALKQTPRIVDYTCIPKRPKQSNNSNFFFEKKKTNEHKRSESFDDVFRGEISPTNVK